MAILITGGAGFLGTHLALRLLAEGKTVVLFDREIPAHLHPDLRKFPLAILVEGNIRDRDALAAAIRTHAVTDIVHLATVLTQTAAEDPLLAVEVNAYGSTLIFELARQHRLRRVIFGSSVAALGLQPAGTPGDNSLPDPTSVYGATKAFTEYIAKGMRRDHPGLDLVGLRFGWIYGPGRTRGWNALQKVIEDFSLERPEVKYPDYSAPSDWTYVSDAVEAICLCLEAPQLRQAVYNAPGDYRSIQEAVRHLQHRFPQVQAYPVPAELPPVAWDYRLDGLKLEVGYQPQVSLEHGLDLTLNAIRAAHGLPRIRFDTNKEELPHG